MSGLDCVFIQQLAFTFTFLKQRVQSAVVLFNDVFNPPADFQEEPSCYWDAAIGIFGGERNWGLFFIQQLACNSAFK